uniref:Uncharacterized protein n=1 Tax=Auxenochlorella protothecoides TaxID=3075 RepID=A0A1D2AA54_AUXPR
MECAWFQNTSESGSFACDTCRASPRPVDGSLSDRFLQNSFAWPPPPAPSRTHRGSARVVIMVGTREQVEAAVGAAEPFRERLQAAGVLLVPAAIYDQGSGTSDAAAPQASAADLKWVAQPVRLAEWRTWFEQQTKSQGTPTAGGLYISLRLDGRIRASGRGSPPWEQLAAQLPSVSGFFGGFLDGMDGRV